MKTEPCPRRAEFICAQPDNLILVENHGDEVLIRAAADNFSEERKTMFIRELAAEGFIPDEYEWLCNPAGPHQSGVRWIVDRSWVGIPLVIRQKAGQTVCRAFVATFVVWLVAVGLILTTAARHNARIAISLSQYQSCRAGAGGLR